MTLSLGIDTGGTFTDAVVIDNDQIVGRGKSLTTRHNLSEGIEAAVSEVVSQFATSDISRVSLSTTLATNAMVEGHGRPAALIMIGQPDGLLDRSRLKQALGNDPVIQVQGGHSAYGDEQAALDEVKITQAIDQYATKVSGFAVAGYFAVRNPAHEQRVRDFILEKTDLPVSCSHELSERLDAPRRALTALLNARLVPMLTELIEAVRQTLSHLAIDAPLMIVQGDGSLVLGDVAMTRPVETILSGPAASVMGARWLTGLTDALISDMGGTTTDIACLSDGQPQRNLDGARVGGWHTMVEAIAVHTHALGGDSEVNLDDDQVISLGPQRAVPLSLLADQYPDVLDTLKAQLAQTASVWDGRFAQRIRPDVTPTGLTKLDAVLLETLGNDPVAFSTLMEDPRLERPLNRLRSRGIIAVSQFTPSDALHVLGHHQLWSRLGATLSAQLLVRRFHYEVTEAMVSELCQRIVDEVTRATGVLLIESALASDTNLHLPTSGVGRWLVDTSMRKKTSHLLQPTIRLRTPVVGIGAPAHAYYQPLGDTLATEVVVPDGANVCNAIGAAVSRVIRRSVYTLTSPAEGVFRVHADAGVADFRTRDEAVDHATDGARRTVRELALVAGCSSPDIDVRTSFKVATAADGTEVFVEGRIMATATGY